MLWLVVLACAERYPVQADRSIANPPAAWKAVLRKATVGDQVDYDFIEAQRPVLQTYLHFVADRGPVIDDWKESKEDKRISYMANAYNAAVIYGVLEHRPLASVRDVDIGMYRVPAGAGFFAGQRFRIDGEWLSLHTLETQLIVHRYQEPLTHMVLNCASVGCPPLRWWEEKNLQKAMGNALRRYLASPQGLVQTDGGWAVTELFFWYEKDFVVWGEVDNLCQYLVTYVPMRARPWFEAHAEDCPLERFDYDWSLNAR